MRRRRDFRVEALESRRLMASRVISGFVYADTNRDGIFDAGERPIANSSIALKDASGAIVGTTTTDANGRYQFTVDLTTTAPPATTAVRVAALPLVTTPTTRTVTLPQFDPALGTLTSVDVVDQLNLTSRILVENASDQPATLSAMTSATQEIAGPGLPAPFAASDGDSVSFDATAYDGASDFGGTSGKDFGQRSATSVQSATINDPAALTAFLGTGVVSYTATGSAASSVTGSGDVVQVITTLVGGSVSLVYHYTPTPIASPTAFTIVQTVQPAGFTDGPESRITTVIPNSIGTDLIPVDVAAGDVPGNNFGEFPIVAPTAVSSLSGFVYLDSNADGVREPDEFGIAHAKVTLTGLDGRGRIISRTTTTANDGSYRFGNLAAGTYTITKAPLPVFIDGRDSAGSLGGTVTNNRISSIVVPAGVDGIQYNFAELARPNCRVNQLIALNRLDGFTLPANQIGSLIRTYVPTLVPILTRPALAAAARRVIRG